jgi:hypothetical protein
MFESMIAASILIFIGLSVDYLSLKLVFLRESLCATVSILILGSAWFLLKDQFRYDTLSAVVGIYLGTIIGFSLFFFVRSLPHMRLGLGIGRDSERKVTQ